MTNDDWEKLIWAILKKTVFYFSLSDRKSFTFCSICGIFFNLAILALNLPFPPPLPSSKSQSLRRRSELNLFATSACKMFSTICNIGISIVFNDVQRQHINCSFVTPEDSFQ